MKLIWGFTCPITINTNANTTRSGSTSSEEIIIPSDRRHSSSNTPAHLLISRLENNKKDLINRIKVYPDIRNNVTQIHIPCRNFQRGGVYELQIVEDGLEADSQTLDINDERLKQQLDVRWPVPELKVSPQKFGTYPENPVKVLVSFPDVECELTRATALKANISEKQLPEFWLELIYCGEENLCDGSNSSINSISGTNTKSSVLYAEQILGFPQERRITLKCELFGFAGHYAIVLRPTKPTPSFVTAISYVQADWSKKFVFNVHARSIFPCDPHTGVGVLFEYPACILDKSDRVRLYAKLRADVASLKPPTSLHYVTEQRVNKGKHSLHFDCDLFSEKYVEYCFVYVSQAITDAGPTFEWTVFQRSPLK
uniref:Uncharacterized protein n=1 Tax=Megaselia scalaris TaxID=36166 RepID=T1GYE0_MEGSC